MARHPIRRLAISLAGLAAYARWVRPRLLHWGAAGDEARRRLPGDELIPGVAGRSTQAITLEAPPREVWPWLVQMGCRRAGWYAYDRLDNAGMPSADRIHPELQDLKRGDRIPSTPHGTFWFDVVELVPERVLVLRHTSNPLLLRMGAPGRPPGRVHLDSTWAFALEPLDEGRRTRILVRTRLTGWPGFLWTSFDFLFGEPGHFLMQRKQLLNLKRRVEGMKASRGPLLVRAARPGAPDRPAPRGDPPPW